MATQENTPFPGALPRVPTLVEVTNQLTNPADQQGPVQLPPRPQVVLVSSERCPENLPGDRPQVNNAVGGDAEFIFTTAIDCEANQPAIEELVAEQEPVAEQELVLDQAMLETSSLADAIVKLAENETQGAPDEDLEQTIASQLQTLSADNLQELSPLSAPLSETWRHNWFSSDEPRFLLDPFDQAIDGPIPILPSLPILNAIEMTENVVSREKKGMHYAWRLKPGPYPDLGNMPEFGSGIREDVAKPAAEINAEEVAEIAEVSEVAEIAETDEAKSNDFENTAWVPDLENWSPQQQPWTQSEVVAEGDSAQYGDDFYAQPGDVISIDGNMGYDHIDLSSYALEDAMFQPGAILLNPKSDNEAEELEPPIIIRYRGIEFAIFAGDVRVEL